MSRAIHADLSHAWSRSPVRPILRMICIFIVLALHSGCSTSEADRAFFEDGWRHPEQGAEKRMNSSDW